MRWSCYMTFVPETGDVWQSCVMRVCMFSGCYKWKSVAFQLKEKTKTKNRWERFSNLSASSWEKHHWIHFAFLLHNSFSAHHFGLFFFLFHLCADVTVWSSFKEKVLLHWVYLSAAICSSRSSKTQKKKSTFFIHFTFFHYPLHLQKHLSLLKG